MATITTCTRKFCNRRRIQIGPVVTVFLKLGPKPKNRHDPSDTEYTLDNIGAGQLISTLVCILIAGLFWRCKKKAASAEGRELVFGSRAIVSPQQVVSIRLLSTLSKSHLVRGISRGWLDRMAENPLSEQAMLLS